MSDEKNTSGAIYNETVETNAGQDAASGTIATQDDNTDEVLKSAHGDVNPDDFSTPLDPEEAKKEGGSGQAQPEGQQQQGQQPGQQQQGQQQQSKKNKEK